MLRGSCSLEVTGTQGEVQDLIMSNGREDLTRWFVYV